MERGERIVLALGVGVVGWYLLQRLAVAAAPPPSWVPPGSVDAPPPIPTKPAPSTDLDPIAKLVTYLPGLSLAYAIEKPIADKVIDPAINKVNQSGAVKAINAAIDTGTIQVTQNADGTITRTVKNPSWYDSHIGQPISSGLTSAGKAFISIF